MKESLSDLSFEGSQDPTGQSTRQLRVGEEIRRVLAESFMRTEFRDPELNGVQVTVTEVRVAPDFRHATVFVIRLGRSDIAMLLPALGRVAPFLRKILSRKLHLRSVPELHFQADTSLDHAMEMDALLRSESVQRDLQDQEAESEDNIPQDQAD